MSKTALWWIVLACAAPCLGAELFVGITGADSNAGTRQSPFATLERARDEIRAMKARRGLPAGGVVVRIGAGRYELARGLRFSEQDSGAPGKPVVYRADPGAEVRLSGGRQVSGFHAVRDPAVQSRLSPLYRDRILEVDLRALGIRDFGELTPRGFGSVRPAALELFFQDRPMTLARWPNEGFVKVAGLPRGEAEKIADIHAQGSTGGRFIYSDDRPERWAASSDVWLHGYWRYDWADTYARVRAIDTGAHQILTDGSPGPYGIAPGQRYYYLNVLEELDSPGEWFLDRKTGKLYFWPPAPVESAPLVVSLLAEPLISCERASHITFQGLVLEHGRANGVEIRGGERVLLAGCTLRNLGSYAAVIEGGSAHGVTGCDIYGTGDGGIQLHGGDRRTLRAAGHFATNNHIHHFDRWTRTYCPAVLVAGVGNRVAHNLIHDSPHNAVQLSGNDHVIEYNEIHHVALETGDVGAFYIGRNWTERGNIVRYNYFHDIGDAGRDVRVVYLDDCASGTTVFGNIIRRATRGVIIGGGRDNRVENNIFLECEPAVRIDDRCASPRQVWRDMAYGKMKKDLEDLGDSLALYRNRYPALSGIDHYYDGGSGIPPEGNVIERNISAGSSFLSFRLENPPVRETFTVKDNLLDQPPGFVDAMGRNLRLKPDSPAFKLGFRPIPVEEIGLYRDQYRAKLP